MVAADGLETLHRLTKDSDRERIDRENRVAARAILQMPFYSPGRNTAKITAPTLVQIATQDILTPTAAAQRAAQRIPTVEIKTYDCGHFEPYIAPHFEGIITDQLDFLQRTVPTN